MDLCLNWGSCKQQERHEKGVLRAKHPCITFSGEFPPPDHLLTSQPVICLLDDQVSMFRGQKRKYSGLYVTHPLYLDQSMNECRNTYLVKI